MDVSPRTSGAAWRSLAREVGKFWRAKEALFRTHPLSADAELEAADVSEDWAESSESDFEEDEEALAAEIPDPARVFCYNANDALPVVRDAAVEIFTDGSGRCVVNGETHAGWGVYARVGARRFVEIGGQARATNNEGEMTALIQACDLACDLCSQPECPNGPVLIRYDSTYAAYSATGIFNGKKNKGLVRDARLALLRLMALREVRLMHVKGHSGAPGNERADTLAQEGKSGPFRRIADYPASALAHCPGLHWDMEDARDSRGCRTPPVFDALEPDQ